MALVEARRAHSDDRTAAPTFELMPEWARNGAWLVAIALILALYFWAPWPSEWITTTILIGVITLLFVMERML